MSKKGVRNEIEERKAEEKTREDLREVMSGAVAKQDKDLEFG